MFYTYQQFETLKIQNQFEVRCIILMAYSVTLVMKRLESSRSWGYKIKAVVQCLKFKIFTINFQQDLSECNVLEIGLAVHGIVQIILCNFAVWTNIRVDQRGKSNQLIRQMEKTPFS